MHRNSLEDSGFSSAEAKHPHRATSLSLFSGIGGFEVGMRSLGLRFLRALEIDAACCETLGVNRLHTEALPIEPTDITVTPPEKFFQGSVDYIVGGPPCQSFSAAGRRAGGVPGINDARGSLFWYYCKYVEYFSPKAFVFENVRGILSSSRGEDFQVICNSFSEVGYRLYWRVLNAADFGVPQFRERLFLVGIRDDLKTEFRFPRPTHGPDAPGSNSFISVEKALLGVSPPVGEPRPYGGKYGHLLPEIPEGENYRFFTEEMGHPNPQFAWRSKFSGFLYKMARNEPCRTIVSQQSRYDGPFHWENRKCTVDELKVLQGFPRDFVIPHGYTAAVKQIGNSVAPPVAMAIGRALRFQIENLKSFECELLEDDEVLGFDARKRQRAVSTSQRKTAGYKEILQPSLFEDMTKKTLNSEASVISEFDDDDVRVRITSSEGKALVTMTADSDNDHVLETFVLTFFGGFAERLNEVKVLSSQLKSDERRFTRIWDALHSLVSEISNYESLLPLWGHFTEPYPKFHIKFESECRDQMAQFQRFAISKSLIKESLPIEALSVKVKNPWNFLNKTRVLGFDVRTPSTNQTIKRDHFRVCYPFTLPRGLR